MAFFSHARTTFFSLACLLIVTSGATAQTGSITGTISNAADGTPVSTVSVSVYNSGGAFIKNVVPNGSGAYTAGGLSTGSYFVRTAGSTYISEVYNGFLCAPFCPITNGTPVPVVDGSTTASIDFALDRAGTITGTVTDAATGQPLAGVTAQVALPGQVTYLPTTNASGVYTAPGLTPGTYYVRTSVATYHINELYDDLPCSPTCTVTDGTPVLVTGGITTNGIDFSLALGAGAISGTVTDSASGLPVAGATVQAYTLGGTWLVGVLTIANGSYTIGGLPPGSYLVRTNTTTHLNEVYNNVPCPPGCAVTAGTPVSIAAGATTSGIDFSLASGGTISGTVTDAASGTPLAFVSVQVYTSTGTFVNSLSTNASGVYSVGGLPTGLYVVRTSATAHDDELYNNISCSSGCTVTTGTPIAVTAGATTSGIDFALTQGGSISGTVTNAVGGSPVPSLSVSLYGSGGTFVKSVSTNSSGAYTIGGLATGTYFVRTTGGTLVNELYNNIPCSPSCTVTTGAPISVTAGSPTSGIDFSLDQGGAISGTVTSGGSPAASVFVQLYNSGGTFLASVSTNASGAYSLAGLATGTYFVRTSGPLHFNELYDDLPCSPSCTVTAGTPVSVAAGITTGGVDFSLEQAGLISGTVSDSVSGAPIITASVQVYASSGTLLTTVFTNSSGIYTAGNLASGAYFVRTNTTTHLNELYNNLPCSPTCVVTTGTPVSVTSGTTSGIDFALAVGGRISGTIRNSSAVPIAGVNVRATSATGALASSTNTNASGSYTLTLADGQYFVSTSNSLGYIDEVHDSTWCVGCLVTTGNAVTVAGPGTTTVDFTLEAGGRISGTVTNASSGSPMLNAQVAILDSNGRTLTATSATNASGAYASTGLPSGNYFARVSFVPATSNGLAELYDNVPCMSVACNVFTNLLLDGTPVAVTMGSTTTGINFALEPGGRISGTVTKASDGTGATGITVQVYDGDGVLVGSGAVVANGTYTTSPLQPGDYFVTTAAAATPGNGYVNKLYDDLTCVGCTVTAGGSVTVTAGQTTTGINFSLVTGWRIGGLVTDESAVPLSGVTVGIYNANGLFVGAATTTADGQYISREGLIDGTYYIRTLNSLGMLNELYDNVSCSPTCISTSGTAVVISGGDVTGVDFELSSGGRISGAITDATTGAPVFAVGVRLFDDSGQPVQNAAALNPAQAGGPGMPFSSLGGVFTTFGGLLPGTYYAVTDNRVGYVNKVFTASGGTDCVGCDPVSTGAAITVTAGNTTTGVDFALTAGGRVEGTITDGSVPLKNVTVEIFADPFQLPAATGITNQTGRFITRSGLPDGTDYRARTANSLGFLNEVFSNFPCTVSCLPGNGSTIAVTVPFVTTGIDFALDPDGDGDNDGIVDTADWNRITLASESSTFSSDFADVPLTGVSAGTITDRAGWDVIVGDISPGGVQASLSGSGSGPAVLETCHDGDAEEVLLDSDGETATIVCTSATGGTTVRALAAWPFVELRKTVGSVTTVLEIPRHQTATLGSPAVADPDNTEPIGVRLEDEFGTEIGSFSLDPGESAEVNSVANTIVVSVGDGAIDVTVGQETIALGPDQEHTFCPTGNCGPGPSLLSTTVWVGLKNSDDQGTQFDLRADLYKNGALLSSGELLCITGVVRNANLAKEVTVTFAPYDPGAIGPDDAWSMTLQARIGTTPEGNKCSGPGGSHSNAAGLRLYFDSAGRPSQVGPTDPLFLDRTSGVLMLSITPPAGSTAQSQDSTGVNFNGGNPWKVIGTWVQP